MPRVGEIMACLDEDVPARRFSTGIRALDLFSGGVQHGDTWVVTGLPGEGKSTLLVQLAVRLGGEHGVDTRLEAHRDTDRTLIQRLLSCLSRVDARQAERSALPKVRQDRLLGGRQELARLPITIETGPLTGTIGDPPESAVAVLTDDVDLPPRGGIDELKAAQHHLTRIVTAGRWNVLDDDGHLLREWVGIADVVVEVRTTGRAFNLRPGAGELHIAYNRRGPIGVCEVFNQGTCSRFTDMARR